MKPSQRSHSETPTFVQAQGNAGNIDPVSGKSGECSPAGRSSICDTRVSVTNMFDNAREPGFLN